MNEQHNDAHNATDENAATTADYSFPSLPFHIGLPTFFCIVVAAGVVSGSYSNLKEWMRYQPEPRILTVRQLAEAENRGNTHVILRDAELVVDSAVVTTIEVLGQQVGEWDSVFVAAVEKGPSPRNNRQVLLRFLDVDSADALYSRAAHNEFEGMLVKRSFDKPVQERLESGFPGIKLDSVPLLTVDTVPKNPTWQWAAIAASVVVLAVGLFLARGPGKWFWD